MQVTRPWHVYEKEITNPSIPFTKPAGAQLLVEDLEGTLNTVSAYNVLSPFSGTVDDATYAFPLDSVYLIFEPTFDETYIHATETYYNRKPTHLIRVDNPTHMIRLNDVSRDNLPDLQDEKLQETLLSWLGLSKSLKHVKRDKSMNMTLEEILTAAETAMQKQRYTKAAAMYTLEIEMLESPSSSTASSNSSSKSNTNIISLALAYANRTKVLLKIDEYLMALRDARQCVDLLERIPAPKRLTVPGLSDIPVLLAKTLMHLQIFEEALEVLDKYDGLFEKIENRDVVNEAKDIRSKVESMLNKDTNSWLQPSCINDMVHAHVAREKQGDIADFWYPNYIAKGLQCQIVPWKGDLRGVVATEDLPAGSIIFATKATTLWKEKATPFDPPFRHFKLSRWQLLQSVIAGACDVSSFECASGLVYISTFDACT